MIHVLDADALWHLMNTKDFKKIDFLNSKFILTPNKNELIRLFNKCFENDINLIDKAIDHDFYQGAFFDCIKENESIV
jgi:NAD(P)H-hydrate repair Nnr-like enzyme with NAD(P)H-hydrate dehydratase domain